MKKIISIILLFVCISVQAHAEKLNNDIGKSLFESKANRLISAVIGENTVTLPDFFNMEKLKNISVHEKNVNYKSIDGVLYSKDGKTLICYPSDKSGDVFVCPDGVEYIMSGAFCKNKNISAVFLPESLIDIGANPFEECKNLKMIEVSRKNNYFCDDNGILYSKTKDKLLACPCAIQKPRIPEGVCQIGYSAFSGCDKIYEIDLPDSLNFLESMAFKGCTKLKKIVIPDGVGKLNLSCFKGCTNLENISVENSEYYKSVDGILYSFDMYELVYCPEGKIGEVIIPESVRNILNGAFDNCEKITRVVMPESMENVARAFYGCKSLKNVEIPGNQAILEYGTFYGCSSLEWIYLPNNVVIIQENAIPEKTLIYCDEDSFASFYAEENQRPFRVKINVLVSEKSVKYENQPFEEKGEIYIHAGETVEAFGGSWRWNTDKNCRSAMLGNMTVDFEMVRAERRILNQAEYVTLRNIKYVGEELYIEAEEFAEIFNLQVKTEGNIISLFQDRKEE